MQGAGAGEEARGKIIELQAFSMARPIELGLILEGEDAEEFLEDLKNPKKPTKEQMEMFREAIRIYKEHPVS